MRVVLLGPPGAGKVHRQRASQMPTPFLIFPLEIFSEKI